MPCSSKALRMSSSSGRWSNAFGSRSRCEGHASSCCLQSTQGSRPEQASRAKEGSRTRSATRRSAFGNHPADADRCRSGPSVWCLQILINRKSTAASPSWSPPHRDGCMNPAVPSEARPLGTHAYAGAVSRCRDHFVSGAHEHTARCRV
jgi:hypothetical protein